MSMRVKPHLLAVEIVVEKHPGKDEEEEDALEDGSCKTALVEHFLDLGAGCRRVWRPLAFLPEPQITEYPLRN